MVAKRLLSTPSLTQVLPKGAEGGKEFARIVNLLLIHDARRRGQTLTHLDDAACDVAALASFAETRKKYDNNLYETHGKIQFVGMSIRTDEATRGVPLESIYIPLQLVAESASNEDESAARTDPLTLMASGQRHMILGDPGTGKS